LRFFGCRAASAPLMPSVNPEIELNSPSAGQIAEVEVKAFRAVFGSTAAIAG
jgi:hypothetical protein